MTMTDELPALERTREFLQRAGNPFRNYFARNPDDDICARYHVPELFAAERDLLHAIIDLYRYDPTTHSEVVPILGNKGAGKTHLLHSIKHGAGGHWQLLVTPGVYQKDSEFLEYMLFQIIDTLLGGGKQKGCRPLEYVGDQLVRRQLGLALRDISPAEKVDLFPPPGLGKWARRLGLGSGQAAERAEWLIENLSGYSNFARVPMPLLRAIQDAGMTPQKAFDLCVSHIDRTEGHNTAGLMRRHLLQGFAKAALLGDESELANFLTYGFAELDFRVKPSRQDLVVALFKVLMEIFRGLKIPVVVAFDQLEDLLLSRRNDDGHKIAEAFFAGIVQGMHQIDGLLFLIFAERGLWNRFVPSLDGYIQDRLNNPVHVPKFGTVKAVRLEAPAPEMVKQVVEARLRPVLDEIPDSGDLPEMFPFREEQIVRVARTEPTLRDMLQQLRHLFDHLVYGPEEAGEAPRKPMHEPLASRLLGYDDVPIFQPEAESKQNRIDALLGKEPEISLKNVDIIDANDAEEYRAEGIIPLEMHSEPATGLVGIAPTPAMLYTPPMSRLLTADTMAELWEQEFRAARRKLEPEGSLTGATRELQAALGTFLGTCHEHGVKVGPWRLQHTVAEWPYGEHPTYGVVSLAHWACKDSNPWKVGIGLFLARGPGKLKDLEIKLSVMNATPPMVDHLILLRQEDDTALTGKSKQAWQDAARAGKHARLEAISSDGFAQLYSFPRWLAALHEALPAGAPLPNLADIIQEKAEKLLEQVCMPVQG